METKRKFFSLSNLPKIKPVSSGKKIYNYQTMDKTGKLVNHSKNMYEMIQSSKNQVDYKKRFNEGEITDNGNLMYFDTTKLSMDYLAGLSGIANDIRQKVETSKTTEATGQADKPTSQDGQTKPSATVIQPSSTDSTGSATIDGGNE